MTYMMVVDWIKSLRKKRRLTPQNVKEYLIHQDVVEFTEQILREYGKRKPASEGVVYWAGRIDGDRFLISCAVAPKTSASRYGFEVSHYDNATFAELTSDHKLVYLCQVHSHPGTWVNHSDVDDEMTAFKHEGLISIVVPCFAKGGMLPFQTCGIHLFRSGRFVRLANKYIQTQFKTFGAGQPVILKDLR